MELGSQKLLSDECFSLPEKVKLIGELTKSINKKSFCHFHKSPLYCIYTFAQQANDIVGRDLGKYVGILQEGIGQRPLVLVEANDFLLNGAVRLRPSVVAVFLGN